MSPLERRGPVLDALSVTVSTRTRALNVLETKEGRRRASTSPNADADADAADAAHTA
jgi:hypothetical protein